MNIKSSGDVEILANARAKNDRDKLAEALVRAGSGDRSSFEYVYRQTSAKQIGRAHV